jgi:lipoyl-dependent peroxiredoxin
MALHSSLYRNVSTVDVETCAYTKAPGRTRAGYVVAFQYVHRATSPRRLQSGSQQPGDDEALVASRFALHEANWSERNMSRIEQVLYTAKTHTTGGRDGAARSSDGRLDIKLSPPGSTGVGTNPEQLLGAGWSACFIGAMGKAAGALKVALPADTSVDTEIDLGTTDGAYFIQARLSVSLPGLPRDVAQAVIERAHQTCPYSKATRGNIDVSVTLV